MCKTHSNKPKKTFFLMFPPHFPSFSIIFPSFFHHFPIIFHHFEQKIPQMYGFLTSAPRSLGSLASLRSTPCRGVRSRVATAAPGRGLERWTPLALAVLGGRLGRRRVANMAKVVPGR